MLAEQHPEVRRSIGVLKHLSAEERVRELAERQWLFELDQRALLDHALKQGLKNGLQQGLDQGLKQGIEQGIKQGIEQGIDQGLSQGIKRSYRDTAIRMIKRNRPIDEIAEFSTLSIEEIHEIKRELEASGD
jgi:flagellar biosynthesis/type III secretory pathway protein FliH